MPKVEGVRYLRNSFEKALILGHPDPSLDDYLEDQNIEPDRRSTRDPDEVVRILEEGQHDLLYKRSTFEVDRRVLRASDNLASVMLCCIGDDSVDKQACAEEGVLAMNDPVSNGWSVVEMILGEMICLARRIFHATTETAKSNWTKTNDSRYELRGKSLSIIGLGHIGKEVAKMAEGFDMNIHFYDSYDVAREVGETLGWDACDSAAEAFRKGDFVTVHVSAEDCYGNSNEGLLNYEQHFSQLGADRDENSPKIFLNASRGFLFDPDDLKKAVRRGEINYAAVDVYPEEPANKSDPWKNPYEDVDEIVCTPHIGAATQEAQPRIARHKAMSTRLLNCYGAARNPVFGKGTPIALQTEDPSYVLTVMHSDARGTKKAVDDCIYEAGLSNLQSSHQDFPRYGIAYDVNALDEPLSRTQLKTLVEAARDITGREDAIRSIRMIEVDRTPCNAGS